MVADQHRGAGRPVFVEAAAAVGQHEGLAAGGRRGAHAVDHGADALALVVVRAGAQDQGALALLGQHRADGAHVPLHGRCGEAGDFGGGQGGGGLADQLGGVAPARAEDQRDVVGLDARLCGDVVGGGAGGVEGVRVQEFCCTHRYKLSRAGGRAAQHARPDRARGPDSWWLPVRMVDNG